MKHERCYCGICSGWKECDQYGIWWHTVRFNGLYERQRVSR